MAKHSIAEQEEIIILNKLKALFNSIRSTTWLTITHTEFMEAQEINFVLGRIKIFEKEMAHLEKPNKKLIHTLKKGLQQFKKSVLTTPVHLVMRLFRDKIVLPLENAMLKIHQKPEEKNWVRTSFVILRD